MPFHARGAEHDVDAGETRPRQPGGAAWCCDVRCDRPEPHFVGPCRLSGLELEGRAAVELYVPVGARSPSIISRSKQFGNDAAWLARWAVGLVGSVCAKARHGLARPVGLACCDHNEGRRGLVGKYNGGACSSCVVRRHRCFRAA